MHMRIQTLKAFATLLIVLSGVVHLSAQFELTVRPMLKENTYGVFVKVQDEFTPSDRVLTGTGQVTLVLSNYIEVEGVQSFFGDWSSYDLVQSPDENPGKNYLSVGLTGGYEDISYTPGAETLLFTVATQTDTPFGEVALIENDLDPFAQLPNSFSTNPGNELSAVDPLDGMRVYRYAGNYASFGYAGTAQTKKKMNGKDVLTAKQ